MTAVIYARYSSDNQREESIEGQIRECTSYAEKNGMTVVRHYIDRAISAKTDNRPEFQQMIKDSDKKLFDIVLVWKLDRFARNRYDSAPHKAQQGLFDQGQGGGQVDVQGRAPVHQADGAVQQGADVIDAAPDLRHAAVHPQQAVDRLHGGADRILGGKDGVPGGLPPSVVLQSLLQFVQSLCAVALYGAF